MLRTVLSTTVALCFFRNAAGEAPIPVFHELAEVRTVDFPAIPNASTIVGKTIAGYQGWFGTPNDDDNNGW